MVELRPERTTLAVVVVLFLGSLPLGLSSPWLTPAFLVPLGMLVWVLRARVVATSQGLQVSNGLRLRRIAWNEVDRFQVPKHGPVVLHPSQGAPVRLTAMARRDLPRVIAAGQPA